MARFDYLLPNPLDLQQRRRAQLKWLGLGSLMAAGAFTHQPLFWLGAVLSLGLPTTSPIRAAGAAGERLALGQRNSQPGSLGTLSEAYTVFNNLVIPDGHGTRELDLVVVGPTTTFVVEVKHYAGSITGAANDPVWQQRKHLRQSKSPINRECRNPVKQVQQQVRALCHLLDRCGHDGWIQGIVVMTHPRVELAVAPSRTPVLRLEHLAGYIQQYTPPRYATAPGLPTWILKQVREAMLCPTAGIGLLRRLQAYWTGRRPWMREFQPQPFPRYWPGMLPPRTFSDTGKRARNTPPRIGQARHVSHWLPDILDHCARQEGTAK